MNQGRSERVASAEDAAVGEEGVLAEAAGLAGAS